MNRGITDEMSPEEIQEQKDKNRRKAIIGATVIGLAVVGVGIMIGANVAENAQDVPVTPEDIFNADDGESAGRALAAAGDIAPAVPEYVPNLTEAFNIGSGQGGEALFNGLGIDPAKFYANQESLLANFPSDFYRMDGGGVGISHTGWLTPGAQEAIEALR